MTVPGNPVADVGGDSRIRNFDSYFHTKLFLHNITVIWINIGLKHIVVHFDA